MFLDETYVSLGDMGFLVALGALGYKGVLR